MCFVCVFVCVCVCVCVCVSTVYNKTVRHGENSSDTFQHVLLFTFQRGHVKIVSQKSSSACFWGGSKMAALN